LAVYRTAKALAELRDEFGEAKDFHDYDTLLAFVMEKPFAPLPEHEQEIVRRTQQWLRENRPANLEDLSKPKSKQPSKKRRRR
jgi:hypothetical protein